MTCVGWARRCAIGVCLCVGLNGCFPAGDSQLDEKKEPHFITGKNLVGQMDYQGAIDSFEKALEVNPRSASAHFELGWLYEEKVNDPAAAIYHYDRYLKFTATPDKTDLVRQHINSCKLELAKAVSAVGPMSSGAQRELERVALENKELQQKIATLQSDLAQAKAAPMSRSQAIVVPMAQNPTVNPNPPRTMVEPTHAESPHAAASHPVVARTSGSAVARTHSIKSGETLAAIARKYNISVNALMAANPQVKPSRLQVGQTLNIPAP